MASYILFQMLEELSSIWICLPLGGACIGYTADFFLDIYANHSNKSWASASSSTSMLPAPFWKCTGGLIVVVGLSYAAFSYHLYVTRQLTHREDVIHQSRLSISRLESALKDCSKERKADQASYSCKVETLESTIESTIQQLQISEAECSSLKIQSEEQYEVLKTLQQEKLRDATIKHRQPVESGDFITAIVKRSYRLQRIINALLKANDVLKKKYNKEHQKMTDLEKMLDVKELLIKQYLNELDSLRSGQVPGILADTNTGEKDEHCNVFFHAIEQGSGDDHKVPPETTTNNSDELMEDDNDDAILHLQEAVRVKNELIDVQKEIIRNLRRDIEKGRCHTMTLESTISGLEDELSQQGILINRLAKELKATKSSVNTVTHSHVAF